MLKKSGEIQSTNQLMKVLKVGTKIAVGGPATAGAGWGASALLGKVMTDPQFAAKTVKALQVGQRVAPAKCERLPSDSSGPERTGTSVKSTVELLTAAQA